MVAGVELDRAIETRARAARGPAKQSERGPPFDTTGRVRLSSEFAPRSSVRSRGSQMRRRRASSAVAPMPITPSDVGSGTGVGGTNCASGVIATLSI